MTVYVLQFHTLTREGVSEAHEPGTSYDVPDDQVDNLVGQGLVTTTEPKAPETPAE